MNNIYTVDDMAYQCLCGKLFSELKYLNRYIKSFTRLFSCSQCSTTCKYNSNLWKHVKLKHPESPLPPTTHKSRTFYIPTSFYEELVSTSCNTSSRVQHGHQISFNFKHIENILLKSSTSTSYTSTSQPASTSSTFTSTPSTSMELPTSTVKHITIYFIWTSHEIFCYNISPTITIKHMHDLLNNNRLYDEIINKYFQLINNRSETSINFPKTFCFNTFFYTGHCKTGYSSRRTKTIDISAKDLLFIPIHRKGHWTLIYI